MKENKKEDKAKNNKEEKREEIHECHPIFMSKRTLSQKAADIFTRGIGSWTFISISILFIAFWIAINSYFLIRYGKGEILDPYPYILLNLVLSTLAAIQAPVILMSQNRASQIDRIRAEYDYAVNRKSGREIQQIQKQLNRIEKRLSNSKK